MRVTHNKHGPRNPWCGPAALSLLTGWTAEKCADRIARLRVGREGRAWGGRWSHGRCGARHVRGADWRELLAVLDLAGVPYRHTGSPEMIWDYVTTPRRKLGAFAREHFEPGRTYLVRTTDHFCVVRDGIVYDNLPGREDGRPLSTQRLRSFRITHALEVTPA